MQSRASQQPEWAERSNGWQGELSTSSVSARYSNWVSALNGLVLHLQTAWPAEQRLNQRSVILNTTASVKTGTTIAQCLWIWINYFEEMVVHIHIYTVTAVRTQKVTDCYLCPYMFSFVVYLVPVFILCCNEFNSNRLVRNFLLKSSRKDTCRNRPMKHNMTTMWLG